MAMNRRMNGARPIPDLPTVRPKIRVPLWVALLDWCLRLVGRFLRLLARHPLVVATGAGLGVLWLRYGWAGLVLLSVAVLLVALVWRLLHPRSFRWVAVRVWGRVRLLVVYRPRWRNAMVECDLAVRHPTSWGERVSYAEVLPRVRAVRSTRWMDRLRVELLYGQTPDDWAAQAEALAHIFRALRCQLREDRSGHVWLEFTRRDPLTRPVAPIDGGVALGDPDRLPIGRREDGDLWILRLRGNHVLVAGATGAGKGSVLQSVIRALGPAVREGLVELWVCDPKGGMEMAFGAPMFRHFAVDGPSIADLLEQAVETMQDRAGRLRGVTRLHVPTRDEPLIVIVIDEIASLTAYVTDRDLRQRIGAALPLLLSQGRAPGVVVLGALQDPRKEVLPMRDLFPTRVVLRMTEAEQVDLVLGNGARDRGALADKIPMSLPGVGYVRIEGQPDPVRVRASWISDDEIFAMADRFATADPHPVSPAGGTALPEDEEWAAFAADFQRRNGLSED